VKNITVSLPDEVHRRARIEAAQRDTPVSALVREFLLSLGAVESDFERRARLQAECSEPSRALGGSHRLKRGRSALSPECAHASRPRASHGRDYDGIRVLNPFRPGVRSSCA